MLMRSDVVLEFIDYECIDKKCRNILHNVFSCVLQQPGLGTGLGGKKILTEFRIFIFG